MVLPTSLGLGQQPGAGGGGAATPPTATPVFHWNFDGASQVMADPGSGNFRVNHASSLSSVSNIALSKTTARGVDITTWLAAMVIGDVLFMLELGDETKHFVSQVHTFGVTDNGTWYQISVLPLSVGPGGMFTDTEEVGVEFTLKPGSGVVSDYIWSFSGPLTTAQNNLIPRLRRLEAGTITELSIVLESAPTGQDAIFSLHINGSPTGDTVTVTAGATTGVAAISTAVGVGDIVHMEIDQVGSVNPGNTATMIARV